MNISLLHNLPCYNEIVKLTLDKPNLTKNQLAHFLAQCHHESVGFTKYEENLNYSAQRLKVVFPRLFPTIEKAQQVVNGGVKSIANAIYGNRMGNTATNAWMYIGKGALHLTGYNNYKAFSNYIKEDCVANPDLVKTKYPLTSAVWFFDTNKLWDLCNGNNVEAVTKRVNGGIIGLQERIRLFNSYLTQIK